MIYVLGALSVVVVAILLRLVVVRRKLAIYEYGVILLIALCWPAVFFVISVAGAIIVTVETLIVLGKCLEIESWAPAQDTVEKIRRALRPIAEHMNKNYQEDDGESRSQK